MDALETRNASKVLISSFFPSSLDLPSVPRGRPNGFPAALTAASASLVRRESNVRSISANRPNRVTMTVVCRSCAPVSRRPSLRANTRIWCVTKVSMRVMISPTERPSRLNSLTRSVSSGARRASKTSTFRVVADRREEACSSRNSSTSIRSARANSKMARRWFLVSWVSFETRR